MFKVLNDSKDIGLFVFEHRRKERGDVQTVICLIFHGRDDILLFNWLRRRLKPPETSMPLSLPGVCKGARGSF
jgi:hypothetical protein